MTAPTGVLFDAELTHRGDLSAFADVYTPEHIYVENDPVHGAARKVMRMVTHATDTALTGNPRTQVSTPALLRPGGEFWVGWSTLLPADFPAIPRGGYLGLASAYGRPYVGPGPNSLGVDDQTQRYRFGPPSDHNPVSGQLVKGVWTDFAAHMRMSPDPAEGFMELWVCAGGAWRSAAIGGERVYRYPSLTPGGNDQGANDWRLSNYFGPPRLFTSAGITQVTVYHADLRIGTSFPAVAPRAYG